jgi:SAM-dependent MidA family methyltransferase
MPLNVIKDDMLLNIIADEIVKQGGMMGVDRLMHLALMHPEYGYYQKQKVFGVKGDFITAPEINQMFGEMVALWLISTVPRDRPWHVVELGGGQGTLMADIGRVLRKFKASFRVTMVETSHRLQKMQAEKLKAYAPAHCHDVSEIKRDAQEYTVVIANEFFDALPAKQFISDGKAWYERMVEMRDDKLSFTKAVMPTALEIPPRNEAVVMTSDMACGILKTLCADEIYGLIFDYGFDEYPAYGDTLQAVQNHHAVPILETLGEADLTMHVDFDALKKAVTALPVKAWGTAPQGLFLERMGMIKRAQSLIAQNPKSKNEIEGAVHRLMAPSQMGQLFKVLALTPRHVTQMPEGFYDGLS